MVFCGKEKERRSGRESGRRMGGRDDCLWDLWVVKCTWRGCEALLELEYCIVRPRMLIGWCLGWGSDFCKMDFVDCSEEGNELNLIGWMCGFWIWHFQAFYSTLSVLFGISFWIVFFLFELDGSDDEWKSRELRLDGE
jgi:hypothetical protein